MLLELITTLPRIGPFIFLSRMAADGARLGLL